MGLKNVAFGLLMADFINKSFFKKKLENVWPFCRAKRIGRNTEVIVLLGFVRCNEISLYRGSFSYILLSVWGKENCSLYRELCHIEVPLYW